MSRVHADAERKFWASIHDRAQMFEAMTNALALSRGVLKQNPELSESQTFARDLETERANLQGVLLGTTTRAARMHDQIIGTERNRALDLFAKRIDRLQQNNFVGGGEINQIVCMNQNRRDFCLLAGFAK